MCPITTDSLMDIIESKMGDSDSGIGVETGSKFYPFGAGIGTFLPTLESE